MKKQTFKFKTNIAVLMVILSVIWVSTAKANDPNQFIKEESGKIRPAEKQHYSKLAPLDAKPQPGQSALDAMTFPLSEWGPLMSWKLLKTNYVSKPLDAFSKVELPANSSKRTRAELDYLLELQRTRTPEELAWCLKLADIYYNPTNINPTDKKYVRTATISFMSGAI